MASLLPAGVAASGTSTTLRYKSYNPGEFKTDAHFYPGIAELPMHATPATFFRLTNEQIALRYMRFHPEANLQALVRMLATPMKFFKWAGTDLMHVTDSKGNSEFTVIECNSCPSGQKSCPARVRSDVQEMYKTLLNHSFLPTLKQNDAEGVLPGGRLAVIYDKNPMEATGYAATLADLTGEAVLLVPFVDKEFSRAGGHECRVRFSSDEARVLEVLDDAGEWVQIRAAFRYVTQKPWNRIPVNSATFIFNPISACLAGGRNKITAAHAYQKFNGRAKESGLRLKFPHTMINVPFGDLRKIVEALNYSAVIKIPYSNAGQGVFVVNSHAEMDAFEARVGSMKDVDRSLFLVQALLGHKFAAGDIESKRVHVGTLPDAKGDRYVFDLRMMVASGPTGFMPLLVYARTAHVPLPDSKETDPEADSHAYYVTNLSVKAAGRPGEFDSDTSRLIPCSLASFDSLGLGVDKLIEGYVQSCMAVTAIDDLCHELHGSSSLRRPTFQMEELARINGDPTLLAEIRAADVTHS